MALTAADISVFGPDAKKQIYAAIAEQERRRKAAELPSEKPSKYKAKKTVLDGIEFDSRKEARRYAELKVQELAGMIRDLRLQVRFELIPAQLRPDGTKEEPCYYIADFVYLDSYGRLVVEDVKGYKKGAVYQLFVCKRKLMLQVHGIVVKEI